MSAELDPLEQHLVDELRSLAPPERGAEIPAEAARAWRAQIESRAIDHAARWLQAQKLGFYTIGSAGHELSLGPLSSVDDVVWPPLYPFMMKPVIWFLSRRTEETTP